MKSKVIGWNINQRSGMGKGIPQFVIDELIDQNADIIVLTELFQHSTIGYFWAEMERAGYQHAVTQNDGTNEVGISVDKEGHQLQPERYYLQRTLAGALVRLSSGYDGR